MAFDQACDDLHTAGKINGLLQAQCLALQAAIDAPDADTKNMASEIAAKIGEAVAFFLAKAVDE